MPVSTTWPHCWHWQSTVLRGPSFSPQKNIALCLGLLSWYLFLTKLGENITKDIFGSSHLSPSLSSSMFSNFSSSATLDRSHLVGDNQHDFFFILVTVRMCIYQQKTPWVIPTETKMFLRMRYWNAYLPAFDRKQRVDACLPFAIQGVFLRDIP